MNVTIGELKGAIEDILEEYDTEVKVMSQASVRKVANKCKRNISTGSKTAGIKGNYAKTWATKTTSKNEESITVTVYSKKPGLPHLLEHGHVIHAHGKICGRTNARVHIKPAEIKANNELLKMIKDNL